METLIRDVRLGEPGRHCNLGLDRGRIVHVGDDDGVRARRVVDAGGALALPGLVEPHCHLDKTYTGQWNFAAGDTGRGSLRDAIAAMTRLKRNRNVADATQRAERAIRRAIANGVCLLRSHLDLSDHDDLQLMESLLALRDVYRDRIRIEFTALAALDTPRQQQLVSQALTAGVDCVGGAPALCEDPYRAIDAAFEMADRFQCPLDLHIDETEDPHSHCLDYLADTVLARNWQGPVLASHCCSLGFQSGSQQRRTMEKVARAGIGIVTLPACNLVLMGRDRVPAPRGIPPVRQLLDAGIHVCAGSDNVQDPFQPWGDYDPLATARTVAEVAQLNDHRDRKHPLTMVTSAAARALGADPASLRVGDRADFCLVAADTVTAAIAEQPLRQWIFFEGRPVLRQSLQQDWLNECHSTERRIPQ